MGPEQLQGGQPTPQPTQLTGSDWQRQAVLAARAAASAQRQNVLAPGMQAAQERAAAQDVPDMLAAVDPVPERQQPAVQQPQMPQQQLTPQSMQQSQFQGMPGQQAAQPIVSGAFAQDVPATAPVVGTGSMSTGKKLLIALAAFVLLAGTGTVLYLVLANQGGGANRTTQQQSADTTNNSASAQVTSRNNKRLLDANRVLTGAAVFMTNNNGKLPTGYSEGSLVGSEGDTPSVLSLEHYQTVQVRSGEQAPLEADELWLVTGVQCDPAGTGSAVVGESSRSIAVMYGRENDTGGFESACESN